jgi:hypothetical protein
VKNTSCPSGPSTKPKPLRALYHFTWASTGPAPPWESMSEGTC